MRQFVISVLICTSVLVSTLPSQAEDMASPRSQESNLSPVDQFKKQNESFGILCQQNLKSSQSIRAKVEKEEQELNLALVEIERLQLGHAVFNYGAPALILSSSAYVSLRIFRLGKKAQQVTVLAEKNFLKQNSKASQGIQEWSRNLENSLKPIAKLTAGNIAFVAISLAGLQWVENAIKERQKTLQEISAEFENDLAMCIGQR